MPKLSFSQDQRKAVLLELGAGRTVREVSRRHKVSIRTLYRWRTMLLGEQQPAKSRLRSLEAEHRRLKRQLAELTLDYMTLRAALLKDAKGDC